MEQGISEFAEEFFQEIVSEADASEQFKEDLFFERFCDHLVEAGEIDSADRAAHKGAPHQGIRVDGYGGDPADGDAGTLVLIIADFQQSAKLERLTGSEMGSIFGRLHRFLVRALEPRWRESLEETSQGSGLATLIDQRWEGVRKVRFLLISNRELSERVGEIAGETVDGRPITHSVWDMRRLHQFVASAKGREDIEVDLEGDFGGALPALPAHVPGADYEAYLVVVPGEVLAKIYDRWTTRLLEQNVRVFLQARGNVNKGIKRTLETDPSMFFAYNNGITATAEGVEFAEGGDGTLLSSVKNLQIVNGGQTTASIHIAHGDRKVDLSRTFVQMKLSVIDPKRVEEVVPKISEYANSQNRINAADFFANHQFHVRLEEFSRRIFAPAPEGAVRASKWFYERARGQYADGRAGRTATLRKKFDLEYPRAQMFTKTDLAKYVSVWEGLPHQVSLGAQKNFALFAKKTGEAWERNADDFNEAWFHEVVAKAIVFKGLERLVPRQGWYQGGYRANIVAYAIAKLAHDVGERKQAVDFERIWRAQVLSAPMEEALLLAAQAAHGVLTNPPSSVSNVTEWAKRQPCWVRVRELEIDWPKEFIDGLLSEEDRRAASRGARKDQRELNGIQAQMEVVQHGPDFWRDVLAWGSERGLLSTKEAGVIKAATKLPGRAPTERQCIVAIRALDRLREEGYGAKSS